MPSFIFIVFVVLKLQIFKNFRGDGASMNWAILGVVLGLNSTKNGSILVKLAPEVVFKERNKVLKFFWEIPMFTETTR